MAYPRIDFLYLSEKDMLAAGVNDVAKCTDCMEEVHETAGQRRLQNGRRRCELSRLYDQLSRRT